MAITKQPEQPDPAERLDIEDERHRLTAQATCDHLSNLAHESRRYAGELAHIERHYRLRRGLPEPGTS